MGGVISAIVASITCGLGWSLCTAASSLCTACCGNDKEFTTSGRKRSVLLLVISIVLALVFQYSLSPALAPKGKISYIPTLGKYLVNSWNDGCADYPDEGLRNECRAHSGVLRVSGCSTLFFLLAAVAAKLKPSLNREAWPAKYVLFLFMVAGSVFLPNSPIFSSIYINIGRFGGILFIFLQQIILIDLAYSWNDSRLAKANDAESEERGSGQKWLTAILISCGVLFASSIVGVILLFNFFSGCKSNEAFIYVTLVMCIIITIVQLCSEESSLLTSAVITSYAVYLTYAAVSKNPDGECNPQLGEDSILDIAFGITLTILSLGWMGWSYTADDRLSTTSGNQAPNTLVELTFPLVESGTPAKGLITNSDLEEYANRVMDNDCMEVDDDNKPTFPCRINMVLAMISCWFAMVLTGWGTSTASGSTANPQVSGVTMWLIICSQWLSLTLYLWTLVAPKIFTDRDFS